MMTLVKPLQPKNASSPIEVTELGMVTDVSPLQLLNVELSIRVTEFGIVTDVSLSQLLNVLAAILVPSNLYLTVCFHSVSNVYVSLTVSCLTSSII